MSIIVQSHRDLSRAVVKASILCVEDIRPQTLPRFAADQTRRADIAVEALTPSIHR